jgi:catechol 2,3-dioxygenase-like lactoylglutathione lyase family enzyme
MIRHVAGIAEVVEDVNEAVQYYRDTLGLEIAPKVVEDYAVIKVPGIGHFGIWDRGHAAEVTFGSREHKDKIPLGIHLEFEADSLDALSQNLKKKGSNIAQDTKKEAWAQKTLRAFSPAGSFLGFAETEKARKIIKHLEFAKDDQ